MIRTSFQFSRLERPFTASYIGSPVPLGFSGLWNYHAVACMVAAHFATQADLLDLPAEEKSSRCARFAGVLAHYGNLYCKSFKAHAIHERELWKVRRSRLGVTPFYSAAQSVLLRLPILAHRCLWRCCIVCLAGRSALELSRWRL